MKALKLVLALLILNACTPTRVSDQISLSAPKEFSHGNSVEITRNLKNWWQGFHDPVLNQLIIEALKANQDLKMAVDRVRQARAMLVVARSVLYPSVDFSTTNINERLMSIFIPTPNPLLGGNSVNLNVPDNVDILNVGLNINWEVDIFGANRLSAEATKAQAEGVEEIYKAVKVGLLAQLSTTYFELRGLQKQIELVNKNIQLQQKRRELLETLFKNGLKTEIDVTQQKSNIKTYEAGLSSLMEAKETLIHRISILLALPPDTMKKRLEQSQTYQTSLPKLPKLIPSELLQQRPDLRRAQKEVTVAAANLGKAKADLLPKFNLVVSGGYASMALSGYPTLANSVYMLGSGLTAPIFNAGRIRAKIAAADARLDEVGIQYEKTLLTALEEVENAYVTHSSANTRKEQFTQANLEAERALIQVDAFFQRGMADYLSVLDAHKEQLKLEQERIKSETAVAVSLVGLYRAMGGGW